MRQTTDEIGRNQAVVNTIIYVGEGGKLSPSTVILVPELSRISGGGEVVHFSIFPSVNGRISGNINEMALSNPCIYLHAIH